MSSEVTFQEEQTNTVGNIGIIRGAPTGMLAWIIKNKLAKDGTGAERLLLVSAIIIVLIAIGIAVATFTPHHAPPPAMIPGSKGQLVPLTHP